MMIKYTLTSKYWVVVSDFNFKRLMVEIVTERRNKERKYDWRLMREGRGEGRERDLLNMKT